MLRAVFIFALLLSPLRLAGQENSRNPLKDLDEKIPVKTTGGILFWGDVLFLDEWHIQKNTALNVFRLLDGDADQHALGSFEDCKKRLEKIQAEKGILPMNGTAVIIMHGFGCNAAVMKDLADWMTEKKTHDYVLNVTYPSTMQSILEHAKMLDGIVKNLPPTVKRIDFAAHSLGSIVVRRYLSGPLDEKWRVPENRLNARKNFSPDPRIGRLVMLGPPNNGSELAAKLIGKSSVRRFLTGQSGDELGTRWEETEKTLGIPCCPFAVVAGGRGDGRGYSTLIPGDDDGVVRTEGTKLEGAEKWIFFNVGHTEMLVDEKVFEEVRKFLLQK
ncbi:MAG: hypothetical protein LBH00_03680 [Planctomycetaceae bacterium]|jgi:hypothetical protein|nr:hypothetical protein [Planctomycetaceae bacterium]